MRGILGALSTRRVRTLTKALAVVIASATIPLNQAAATTGTPHATVVKVLPGRLTNQLGGKHLAVAVDTEIVGIRVPSNTSNYSCSVVLRLGGKVVGRGGIKGSVPGLGVYFPVVIKIEPFFGKPSDARLHCSIATRSRAT
jgi:hypothetical protein